jgi:alpha-1,3-rhamnosyl/mannosyltransferase
LGHIGDLELQELYQRATVLVLVSTYEGFGLPVLEAWQAGCRIVVTDAVARRLPREIVADATVVPTNVTAEHLRAAIQTCLGQGDATLSRQVEHGRTLCETLVTRVA